MIEITIDDEKVKRSLDALAQVGHKLQPAMRKIAATLAAETETNFREEGRPQWPSLSPTTVGMRAKRTGGKRFRILQDSGSLASSISTQHSSASATVGSNKVYAAIHQFGGKAGRNQSVIIPARPYLPLTPKGTLQKETVDEILDTVKRHLESLI
ncbi:phage virion morphogenesis protein [Oligella urethralis]|uniref:phage virion morphogenesis protein n=1 Tax=Oligella urethralis TaxID=90245 RepID=UPI000E0416D1|nr:phage virion morphogenesis protein [Oligella urethralis]SUA58087.1 Mu-like prophage protein gpG [Oligella urethralis]